MSITAVDEHRFKGYTLKGTAQIIPGEEFDEKLIKSWEDKITSRLTQRVIKNLGGQKGHPRHPEIFLPKPKYLIAMRTEEVVDLTPHHIRAAANSK
jgi:hypothetical protein